MNVRVKTVETVKIGVNVVKKDICDGACLSPSKCMEKVAIERALRDFDPKGGDHHVKVDAGSIRFNMWGFKWHAVTPKIAKTNLILFDREIKHRLRIEAKGEVFESKVQPHRYKIEPVKGAKVQPMPPGRQEQINEARRRRIKAGKPDKPRSNFHQRVVGYANV